MTIGDVDGTRLAVQDAYRLLATVPTAEISRVAESFSCYLMPYLAEDKLQVVDGATLNTTVQVAPFAHLFRTFYIIVGHVHASCITDVPVDNHNLAVIARPDVVDPREADGIILVDADAVVVERLDVVLAQRLVVGVVAEAVEEGAYLNAFAPFLAQNVEEQRCDGVVTEVEVFQMDAVACLTDGLEQVVELRLSALQHMYAVIVSESYPVIGHDTTDDAVAGVCQTPCWEKSKDDKHHPYPCVS